MTLISSPQVVDAPAYQSPKSTGSGFLCLNITSIALRTALANDADIEVVDPQPIDLGYERIEFHRMTAAKYVSDRAG